MGGAYPVARWGVATGAAASFHPAGIDVTAASTTIWRSYPPGSRGTLLRPRPLRARFKSVRALRFLLHTLRLRYFCSGKIHKFCCKIASMQVELTLFVTPSLKVSWLPSEVYVLSGDLSKRALRSSPK